MNFSIATYFSSCVKFLNNQNYVLKWQGRKVLLLINQTDRYPVNNEGHHKIKLAIQFAGRLKKSGHQQ